MVREKTVKKVSIIDLGSNSVRMNIVQIQPNGAASLILQEKEMVQLGQDAFLQKKIAGKRHAKNLVGFAEFRCPLQKTFCGRVFGRCDGGGAGRGERQSLFSGNNQANGHCFLFHFRFGRSPAHL